MRDRGEGIDERVANDLQELGIAEQLVVVGEPDEAAPALPIILFWKLIQIAEKNG